MYMTKKGVGDRMTYIDSRHLTRKKLITYNTGWVSEF